MNLTSSKASLALAWIAETSANHCAVARVITGSQGICERLQSEHRVQRAGLDCQGMLPRSTCLHRRQGLIRDRCLPSGRAGNLPCHVLAQCSRLRFPLQGFQALHNRVLDIVFDRNGLVCRQCPRRRSPDESTNIARRHPIPLKNLRQPDQRHLDKRSRTLMPIVILQLRLGQRSPRRGTPVHRPMMPRNQPFPHHLPKHAQLLNLKPRIHRPIRPPSTPPTYSSPRPPPAPAHPALTPPSLPHQPPPAAVKPSIQSVTHDTQDEVLEDLIQRVANMDGAVGVGRAVMEHEIVLVVRVIGASVAVFDEVGGAGASGESGLGERERVVGDSRARRGGGSEGVRG
ncbi:hypothetical protein KC363_g109 [Hortaea werneckii]|nr:hypothetical protein KC363_g109 [Hortaea werneckii]